MRFRTLPSHLMAHAILISWSLMVLFPIWTMLVNSIKPRRDIYSQPFSFPEEITWEGYKNVLEDGSFGIYFRNSITVTTVSLTVAIVAGCMAAHALARWNSRVSALIYLYFIAGLMIPIRLGTINLFKIILDLNLENTLYSLMPVYIAMSLPITVFVMTAYIRGLPNELYDAAMMDGASEFWSFYAITLPLVRPALATVLIFNLIPIWNDLWFPLIFIRAEEARTVTYGVSLLFGQYQTNWTNALAALALAAVPVLVVYILMSGQFIKGLTAGAIKG